MASKDAAAAQALAKKSQKPTYSKFTQQELPACKPILTPGLVMAIFLLLGISFIPIGVTHLSASDRVVEIVDRYDEACVPTSYTNPGYAHYERIHFIQNARRNKTCIRTLVVPKKMRPPIFVYYQLDHFYQNHRRYVKSRNDQQYRSPEDEGQTKNCEPEATANNKPIVPCGLIAWSLFNDTYMLSRNGSPLQINKKGIAWESDRTKKFGSNVYPKNFQNQGLIGGAQLNASIPLSEQEDLLVWMRTAALPTFRKLYGRIDSELDADEKITVVIENNYNTYNFEGQKKLVIATTTWAGGKNDFLGKAYISVGGICVFIAIIFIIVYLLKPRPLGDPSYLSWNRHPSSL